MLTQVSVQMTVEGRRIRVYTRQRVRPSEWDVQGQQCIVAAGVQLRRAQELAAVSQKLKWIRQRIERMDSERGRAGLYLTKEDVQQAVSESRSVQAEATLPMDYLRMLVESYSCGINQRGLKGQSSSQVTYGVALKRLERFCKEKGYGISSWEHFDKQFFAQFTSYLYKFQFVRKGKKMNYSAITVVNTLKVVKNLLHQAYDNDISENQYFNKVHAKVQCVSCDKIYLSEEEVGSLDKLEGLTEEERKVRDMFVISCYTALRISDLNQLGKAMIKDNIITLYQQKTHEQVQIPILKEVAKHVERYRQKGFPVLKTRKANVVIKELAARAGLTEQVPKRENRGGEVSVAQKRKCDMVSFHTARRSCITNLYLRGYPANYLMTLSGHRSLQSLQRYIRATKESTTQSFVEMLKGNNDM